jgi:hypothetical protein
LSFVKARSILFEPALRAAPPTVKSPTPSPTKGNFSQIHTSMFPTMNWFKSTQAHFFSCLAILFEAALRLVPPMVKSPTLSPTREKL